MLSPKALQMRSRTNPLTSGCTATILVNWNGAALTLDCLRSLAAAGVNMPDVYVVDNGSTDGSLGALQAAHTGAVILDAGRNGGFGAGNNVALRHIAGLGYEFVWFLNNDTTVTPETLPRMLVVMTARPDVGAVGCRLVYADEPARVQAWGGGRVSFWLGRSVHARAPLPEGRLDYLTAASVLIRASALERVGLFDEGFFMYWEDTDLSFRLRRAGYKLAVAGQAVVRHRESASAGKGGAKLDEMFSASAARFFLKNYGWCGWQPLLTGAAMRAAKRLVRLQFKRALAVLKGTRAGLRVRIRTRPAPAAARSKMTQCP